MNDNNSHEDKNRGTLKPYPTDSKNLTNNLHKVYSARDTQHQKTHPAETLEKASCALSHIEPSQLTRIERTQIATALKNEFGDSANGTYINWVSRTSNYNKAEYKSIWKNAHKYNTAISTLYHHARQNGYIESNQKLSKAEYAKQQRQIARDNEAKARRDAEQKAQIEADQQQAQTAINEVIPFLVPANANSTNYLRGKKADGRGAYTITRQSIQQAPTASHTFPFNQIKNNALVIPLQNSIGECVSMQLIYEGKKRIVQDSIKRGSYSFIGATPSTDTSKTIYISEGYATANSALQADNSAFSVMAVDADSLPLVTETIRKQYPNASIIIIADNDKSGTGQSRAQEASARANKIILPQWIEEQAKSTDINDVHVLQGIDAVKQLLGVADVPSQPVPEMDYSDCYIPDDDDIDHDDLIASCGINETAYSQDACSSYLCEDVEQRIPQEAIAVALHDSIESLRDSEEYKTALSAGRRYLKRKASGKKAYFVVEQRYVLESLCVCVDLKINSIKLRADMKAGKTYAVEWLLKHHPDIKSVLMVTAVSALVNSIVYRASDKHGIIAETYQSTNGKAELTGSTHNSLHMVTREKGNCAFDLVLVDESESCAGFMCNGTIDNKHQAGAELRKISAASKFVVLADAHLGRDTHIYAEMFFGDREFTSLFNNFKPWHEYARSYLEGYDAGVAHVERLLFLGKKLLIVFNSAALAEQTLLAMIKENVVNRNNVTHILVTGGTAKQEKVKKVIKDNEKFKDYDIAVVSPVAGTGTSIEGEHFNQTVAFISHDAKTPNAYSSLQMLFRARDLIDKHITIVKINNDLMPHELKSFEMIGDDTQEIIDAYAYVSGRAAKDKDAAKIAAKLRNNQTIYEAKIKKSKVAGYWKFWERFDAELDKKRIKVVDVDVATGSFDATEARREARDEIKATSDKKFADATWVDSDDEFTRLKLKNKHDSENMTEDEIYQYKKKLIINRFIPDGEIKDAPTEEQAMQALMLSEKGYSKIMDLIHISQLDYKQIRAIQDAHFNGIGIFEKLKLDIADNDPINLHTRHKIYQSLARIVGLTINSDGKYIVKESVINKKTCISKQGRQNQIAKIATSLGAFNALNDKQLSVAQLKADPLKFVVNELKDGFGLKLRKVRGKDEYKIIGVGVGVDIVNQKLDDDHNGYLRKLAKIEQVKQEEKKFEKTEAALSDVDLNALIDNCTVRTADRYHVMERLMEIDSKDIKAVMEEYNKIATSPKPENTRFQPHALANLHLIDRVEKAQLSALNSAQFITKKGSCNCTGLFLS